MFSGFHKTIIPITCFFSSPYLKYNGSETYNVAFNAFNNRKRLVISKGNWFSFFPSLTNLPTNPLPHPHPHFISFVYCSLGNTMAWDIFRQLQKVGDIERNRFCCFRGLTKQFVFCFWASRALAQTAKGNLNFRNGFGMSKYQFGVQG